MEIENVMKLIDKCKSDICVSNIAQKYMISQVFVVLFTGMFFCLGLFIICKYFTKFLK